MLKHCHALLRRAATSSIAHNAGALYAIQIAGFVLPLLTVPYLARVLRPTGWGAVVFAQSFAAWLSLVLEYGFNLSATRMIARRRDDHEYVASVVAGVQGAKWLLMVPVLALSGLAWYAVPAFRAQPEYLLWAVVNAAVYGLSPFWYFQGVEQMKKPALIEVAARIVATAGIFALVTRPEDGWVVLFLQASTGVLWVGLTTWWMYRQVRFARPTVRASWEMLRSAAGLFVFRAASGVYTFANSFILGMLASRGAVAYYAGADKVVRAAISLLGPVSQALYPRVSHLAASDHDRAGWLIRISLLVVGGAATVFGACIAVTAPMIIRLLLGPEYEAAVPVLRLLAVLLPIIAVGTVLGIQWALPMGLDRPFSALVIGAGALNILLATILAPRFGPMGMAISVVAAESSVVIGLLFLIRSKGRDVWRPFFARNHGGRELHAAVREL